MRKLACFGFGLFVMACGPEGESVGDLMDEPVGARSDAIVNGSPDTTHQAVVSYHMGGKCSATIIEVQGDTGWALTAAHCLKSNNKGELRQGNSHAKNQWDVKYPVTKTYEHPAWTQSGALDFAVLEFSGATASTPMIEAMPPAKDSINKGHKLDVVGYGQTENNNNTLRNHKLLSVEEPSAVRFLINQKTGGMCFGDSGGAALFTTGGTEYVAGVNSAVTGDSRPACSSYAIAARVSAVFDSFIEPAINGTPYLPESCDVCSDAHIKNGLCSSKLGACWDDESAGGCVSFLQCLGGCFSASCAMKCRIDNVAGAALYDAIFACVCNTACATECVGDSKCEPPPTCGLTHPVESCDGCMEASCCDRAKACAVDPECFSCFYAVAPGSECDSNAAYQDLRGCLSATCVDSCGGSTGTGGGETTGAGGAGGMDPVGMGGAATAANGTAAATGGGSGIKRGGYVVSSCHYLPSNGRRSSRPWAIVSLLGLALLGRRRRGACRHAARDLS